LATSQLTGNLIDSSGQPNSSKNAETRIALKCNQPINQPIHQPTEQSTNNPTNQPTIQSTHQPG